MSAETEFQQLVRQVGLDRAEVATRLRYLQWTDDDAARLQAQATARSPAQRAFVEEFYQHIEGFAELRAILDTPQIYSRLKQSQTDYYLRLWHGPYDDQFLLERLRIGWVHQRVGLDTQWYMGGYRLYLSRMLEQLLGEHPQAPTFDSLLKAVFFDMTLAVDTYSAAQRQALEASEARFVRAVRGSNDGIWDWQVETDQLYLSERWLEMLGLPPDDQDRSSARWFSRVHGDDLSCLLRAIDQHLHGVTQTLRHEYRIRTHGGEYLWVLVRGVVAEDAQGVRRMAGSQSDVSLSRATKDTLRHAARHDPLTGLANRARLDELLDQAMQRRCRSGAREAALLFIDLDRFKLINDSLGHAAGDQVLIEVARRLCQCLRPGDHLARFGGDEFVALLDDLAAREDAEHIAQRMLESFRHPFHVDGQTLVISASIGIAALNETDHQLDALQAADMALYRAKLAGKAQFVRYSAELQAQAQRQLELESALGQALEKGQFTLFYQPLCRLLPGASQVVAVEALLRWQYGDRLVSPLEFIPSLEESGEIIAVGEWVLRQACTQVRAWQLRGHAGLICSVNLSSRQLQRSDFVDRVKTILEQTGLAPSDLVLELTESQLMEDTAQVLASLRELANHGIQLALDDFGTGYSSLGYLKRFPLHILKLDKSFIAGVPDDPDSCAISHAIIGLGLSLGLKVVAEGVEQASHLAFLRREGCEFAQGFWFSRPQPAAEMERLLREEHWVETAADRL